MTANAAMQPPNTMRLSQDEENHIHTCEPLQQCAATPHTATDRGNCIARMAAKKNVRSVLSQCPQQPSSEPYSDKYKTPPALTTKHTAAAERQNSTAIDTARHRHRHRHTQQTQQPVQCVPPSAALTSTTSTRAFKTQSINQSRTHQTQRGNVDTLTHTHTRTHAHTPTNTQSPRHHPHGRHMHTPNTTLPKHPPTNTGFFSAPHNNCPHGPRPDSPPNSVAMIITTEFTNASQNPYVGLATIAPNTSSGCSIADGSISVWFCREGKDVGLPHNTRIGEVLLTPIRWVCFGVDRVPARLLPWTRGRLSAFWRCLWTTNGTIENTARHRRIPCRRLCPLKTQCRRYVCVCVCAPFLAPLPFS